MKVLTAFALVLSLNCLVACGEQDAFSQVQSMACEDVDWSVTTSSDNVNASECSMTSEHVRYVLSGARDEWTQCYEEVLEDEGWVEGDLLLGFVILSDGTVRCVDVLENTTQNIKLAACVSSSIWLMNFGELLCPGHTASVQYPIRFRIDRT